MEHYDSWNDAEKLGINYLTGEACGLALRLLCDVNQKGKDSVESFLRTQLVEGSNWNSSVNGEPAVASFMAPRDGFFSSLAAFCHVHQTGCAAAIRDSGEVIGMTSETSGEDYQRARRTWTDARWIVPNTFHPGNGIDNTHAVSGRTC